MQRITLVVSLFFIGTQHVCFALPNPKGTPIRSEVASEWKKEPDGLVWLKWPQGLGQPRIIGVLISGNTVWFRVGFNCPRGTQITHTSFSWEYKKRLGMSEDCNGLRRTDVVIPKPREWEGDEKDLPYDVRMFLEQRRLEWLKSIVPFERM